LLLLCFDPALGFNLPMWLLPEMSNYYCHPGRARGISSPFSDRLQEIHHSASDELASLAQDTALADLTAALAVSEDRKGFSSNLSGTHYRVLCKVENPVERRFL
jgi:hypothetical protein